MTRNDFIEWLNRKTSYISNSSFSVTDYYRELQDYADYIFDYIDVNETDVRFVYIEYYMGGENSFEKTFSFEAFKENYENYTLKD